jgi:hypothetical protein
MKNNIEAKAARLVEELIGGDSTDNSSIVGGVEAPGGEEEEVERTSSEENREVEIGERIKEIAQGLVDGDKGSNGGKEGGDVEELLALADELIELHSDLEPEKDDEKETPADEDAEAERAELGASSEKE